MHFFAFFSAYAVQPHGHICWDMSMPLTSIKCTNPRTNLWNFWKKNIENWWFWKFHFENFILAQTKHFASECIRVISDLGHLLKYVVLSFWSRAHLPTNIYSQKKSWYLDNLILRRHKCWQLNTVRKIKEVNLEER